MTIHYTYRGLSLEYMRGILENVQDKCKRQSFEQIINRDRTSASPQEQLDKILNQKAPEDNPPETREELFRIEERRTEARLLEMGIDSKHMLHFVKTTPGIPEDLRQEMERDYEDKLQAEDSECKYLLQFRKMMKEGISPVDEEMVLELNKLIQQQLMKDIGDTQALYASTLNKPEKR